MGEALVSSEHKLTWLASFSHFITHGYMTLLPALLVVIAGEHSMSFMDIGIIANVGYFLYGLGAFPAGYLADKYGSKRILTIGVIGMAISSLFVGFSPTTTAFAIAYASLGLFASIHHPAGLSLIARHAKAKGRALGLHGVLGNVGLFLTPLMAALCVMLTGSWRAAYISFGVFGIAFFLLLYFARIEHEPDLSLQMLLPWLWKKKTPATSALPLQSASANPNPHKNVDQRPESISVIPVALFILYLGSILSGFIFRGSLTFFPALFKQEIHFITNHDQPVVIAGFVTTAVLSLGLISSWFGGYINDKIKRPEIFPVIIFILVGPTLYFISRLIDSWLIAVSAFFSLVYYAWQPSHNYLIAKYTRKASHGMGFGVNFFLIFGIGSVATASGGYVADNYGIDLFYWIMAIVAFAALLAALTVIMVKRYQIKFSWRMVKEDE